MANITPNAGIARFSAFRRRWHIETKVVSEGDLGSEGAAAPKKRPDAKRSPQRALALRVKFLEPDEFDPSAG